MTDSKTTPLSDLPKSEQTAEATHTELIVNNLPLDYHSEKTALKERVKELEALIKDLGFEWALKNQH